MKMVLIGLGKIGRVQGAVLLETRTRRFLGSHWETIHHHRRPNQLGQTTSEPGPTHMIG